LGGKDAVFLGKEVNKFSIATHLGKMKKKETPGIS